MKKFHLPMLIFCMLLLSCKSGGQTEEPETKGVVLKIKDIDSNSAIEKVFLVLSALDNNRLVRLGEGNTNASGEWSIEYPKSFKGYITATVPGYETIKQNIEYTAGSQKKVELQIKKAESLKILSYNVLKGFENSPEKKQRFINWEKKYDPDIILFQELNYFTEESLQEFARRYGHNYAYITKENGYPTGITSRYPISNIQKITAGQTHGYIHGECKGIHFFAIHLSPKELNTRIEEIGQIIRHAQTLPKDAKIIIAGDFNSYNAYDEKAYGPSFKTDMVKNGHPSVDYTVTNLMLGNGFVDAFTLFSDNHFKQSIPVNMNEYGDDKGCRYDYIFLSKNLANECIYSDILREKETNTLSDHYPNYVKLRNSD